MGAKVWTGKGGASVADPDNWEHLTTAQFNFVENGGEMESVNQYQVKCLECPSVYPVRSVDAVAVCKYGKCFRCLTDAEEEFEPEHLRVIDTQKGVTTRAVAEKAHSDTVKDLAGAADVLKAMGKPGTFQQALQDDRAVWTADDDLDACGGGAEAEAVPVRTIGGKLFNVPEEGAIQPGDIIDNPPDAHVAVPLDDSDEYQVLYVTPWGDELEAVIVDKVRMNPGYYELLCLEISEKPFICCKSDIKSARKVTLEPGDRVDIPGDSLSWFDQCVQFIPLTLIASLCSFAAGAAWYRWMESLGG